MALDVRKLSNEYIEYNYFLDFLMLHTGACFREAAAFLVNKNFNKSIDIYSIDNAFRLTKLEDEQFLEDMLEDLASCNYLDDDLTAVNRLPHRIIELDYEYLLKKTDILELPYIQELNIELSGEKYINSIAEIHENRRRDLMEYRRSGRIEGDDLRQQKIRFKKYKSKAKAEIAELERQLAQAEINIEQLNQQTDASESGKPMHPRTANNASKIIAALTSELLNMDLTQPFANDSNGKIMAAIEKQGNTVSNDVIADWLKLAHENSI